MVFFKNVSHGWLEQYIKDYANQLNGGKEYLNSIDNCGIFESLATIYFFFFERITLRSTKLYHLCVLNIIGLQTNVCEVC